MRKRGIAFSAVILSVGLLVLGLDLLLFAAKLLVLIPSTPELLIEGSVVTGLSLSGAAFAEVLALWGGISVATGRVGNERRGQSVKALLVLLVAGLLASLVPVIPSNAPQVSIGLGGAQPAFLEIVAGNTIRLTNTSSTLGQVFCTGSHSRCQATRDAPAEFAPPGLILQPGQSVEVTFATVGDFHLISTMAARVRLEVLVDEGGGNPNSPSQCDVMQCTY
jgi:plastocyanin